MELLRQPERGTLLLSAPMMNDRFFRQTVVLLLEHGAEGSIGVVLYRDVSGEAHHILEELGVTAEVLVFQGGPVGSDALHFLHRRPDRIAGGQHIVGDVYWGGDFPTLVECIRCGDISKSDAIFFWGYAGWSAGQLDSELQTNSWLLLPASESLIFGGAGLSWSDLLRQLDSDLRLFYNPPKDLTAN